MIVETEHTPNPNTLKFLPGKNFKVSGLGVTSVWTIIISIFIIEKFSYQVNFVRPTIL